MKYEVIPYTANNYRYHKELRSGVCFDSQSIGQGFESPYLQNSIIKPVRGGFEPEPAPTNGRKRGQGCPRQQAEAGWRESAGCGLPEAESPYLQNFIIKPAKGGFEPDPLKMSGEEYRRVPN
jgi:hypothetical protein